MIGLINIRKIITLFVVLTTILILSSNAFAACEVDLSNEFLELRSTGDYSDNISGEDGDEIDIRIGFDIDYVGDDCPNDIETKAKIYRTEDDEDYYTSTTTKRQTLEEGTFLFIWANDFTVNDRYEEYRIEGTIEAEEETFELEGYVTVEDNSCDGINLVTRNFFIDEGETEKRVFRIENDTGKDFEISNVDVYFSTSIVSKGDVDYDSFVNRYDNEPVDVSLTANYTSYDRTATGSFAVSGYLDGEYCSTTKIGRETFEVTIEDTGRTSSGTNSSGECDELSIIARDITVEENNSKRTTFYLNNESTKRFEIIDIDFIEEEIELNDYYFEQYVFPNNLGSITVDAIAPNLTANEVYQNKVRVKGRFSDGKTCNFDNIEKDFEVIVTEAKESLNCENFSMFVPNEVKIKNTGKINYTINNDTIRSVIVNVSGIAEKEIVVPSNSSISNELNVEGNGKVLFSPYIAGCSLSSEEVNVIDTVKGNLEGINMDVRIEDRNTLFVEFNNTTEKQFTGTLRTNIDGYFETSEVITIPLGESFADVSLQENDKTKTGQGTVIFDTGEEELTENVALENEFFAGLFAYGGAIASIAFVLIIIVIAIVVVISIQPERKIEEWENTNKE